MKRFALVAVLAALVCTQSPPIPAQFRVQPVSEQGGHVALGLALRQLRTVGSFMMTTAHPDDENNALLAMMRHGHGLRTTLVTATRGEGGQNEIGPELFDALAVLRSEELIAAHRFDGADQYFCRAVDFGYSFSIEETFERWGKREILADFVRHVRTVRPHVIVGFVWDGEGGGQHHQASSRLTAEAFRAAADPNQFPEQIEEGLRPWQAKKFYYTLPFWMRQGPPDERALTVDASVFDPLLGRTYEQIGSEARSMHKCQGMSQLLALPGRAGRQYRLKDTVLPEQIETSETWMFDGIDVSLRSLVAQAGPTPPDNLVAGLEELERRIDEAERGLTASGPAAAARPLVAGLQIVRELRGKLVAMPVADEGRFELDFRLGEKERQFEHAVLLAHGIRVEALADDGLVTAGQPVNVRLLATNHGDQNVAVKNVSLAGFADARPCVPEPARARAPMPGGVPVPEPVSTGAAESEAPSSPVDTAGARAQAVVEAGVIPRDGVFTCTAAAAVPQDAALTGIHFSRLPDAARYAFDPGVPFGVPFRPTPFRAALTLGFAPDVDIRVDRPVQYRYEGTVFSGEKRSELKVVPALAATSTPGTLIFPARHEPAPTARHSGTAGGRPLAATAQPGASRATSGAGNPEGREVRVTVTNGTRGAVSGDVSLQVPRGWRASPASVAVRFTREDEAATVRFTVWAAERAAPGEYRLRAIVGSNGREFDRGYQVVEYPHIQRRHLVTAAESVMKVIDVQIASGLTVGYIMGVGDQVPPAIEQIGARLEMIDADQLSWGDLSRFDAIVTGVRAYERRADLRAHNDRLLEYVRQGGTLIVQYNKFEFNEAQYGPYPAKVGRDRVTDEASPLEVLAPEHPVFRWPNRIGQTAWQGWVQERGLYFLDEAGRDPRYRDLIQLEDAFEYNPGVKRGALVEAQYGEGRWIYVGLNLWRQLPAGTDGAYQLLANLISLGKTP
jgi:LmbE family N-acetylglucosaminyl deacetylase